MRKWDVEDAGDVHAIMVDIVKQLNMRYIDVERVFCVRSRGSSARAYARIWGLSRIFQFAAGYPATYVIEVLAQHFDKLASDRKKKVIIHELLHIPKTFSGALKSHKSGSYRVDHHEVERMYKRMEK
ncbi:hypothetical protein A3I56_00980 [Candidatus Roizmanbacteria bacterium RIFCSPLOWO2_02_FULL_43_10]|uniref:Putative phage metallopeptidase domain-containing protein n=3 Tax=Candidatus Roizmaniibacteriota TaxID=1752723 RepID=A0A1F7JX16_9BACT|nr:MAG: hypothetical protein A3D08_00755 [Candidatus Roizmanbacteria bacterium RIFCSPHIGHO2_02_FULL_43_11]OGK37860.1 MAG: hypothetical protein A3F32_00290 [Candidatus Roizmanbacteria bacterium RIFCSPHIGHO2_12_FULL_42_10]OGK60153.1 MAG: hypothetical protein A3I56_00980 [Candidatus Roizmanbacteria bacterium RIFCSPLOWO2_02_FULL_43_10]